jgi:chromosome segregation protein
LQELGEINQLAIAEYERVKEEISFKEEQRSDLLAARVELEKNLSEVERKSREVFMEVFEKTNLHFDEVFKRLFPNGQASIGLTDPSDPLESGIDIRAKFPGKKEVDIIQFSGGEKAIVALVLLFAILRVKPSSFTFLDEVEATLDDMNVDKFLTLVNDFLPERQFIIITHNKGTMEFARHLYGITMRRDGISRVVSVNLKEWDEAVLGARTGPGLEESARALKRLPKPKPN